MNAAVKRAEGQARKWRTEVMTHYRKELERLAEQKMAKGMMQELYRVGTLPAVFPLPALLQDSESRLEVRWSNWYDTDRYYGIKY